MLASGVVDYTENVCTPTSGFDMIWNLVNAIRLHKKDFAAALLRTCLLPSAC